jgi:hypothetical protein
MAMGGSDNKACPVMFETLANVPSMGDLSWDLKYPKKPLLSAIICSFTIFSSILTIILAVLR